MNILAIWCRCTWVELHTLSNCTITMDVWSKNTTLQRVPDQRPSNRDLTFACEIQVWSTSIRGSLRSGTHPRLTLLKMTKYKSHEIWWNLDIFIYLGTNAKVYWHCCILSMLHKNIWTPFQNTLILSPIIHKIFLCVASFWSSVIQHERTSHQRPLLLTWINFNPSMDR